LLRVNDEFIFFSAASGKTVEYLMDVFPTLEEKENRSWYHRLKKTQIIQPNVKQKTVVTLTGLKRGLLGSQAAAHSPGAGVTFYDAAAVSLLTSNLAATGDSIALADAAGFAEEGFVWLNGSADGRPAGDDEVVGWLKRAGNALNDCRPFHGRYGTTPADHPTGSVARFLPTRWCDRWTPQYDGPGSAFVQMGRTAREGVWDELQIKIRPESGTLPAQCAPRILARFNGKPAWDGAAAQQSGALLQWDMLPGRGEALFDLKNVQAESVEVRVFWVWRPNVFPGTAEWKREFLLDSIKLSGRRPLLVGRTDWVETR
jgi:hypothetical protein